ncbi:MAG: hypothetical protein ACD_39C01790G0004, partial [uncultured bacterium]
MLEFAFNMLYRENVKSRCDADFVVFPVGKEKNMNESV